MDRAQQKRHSTAPRHSGKPADVGRSIEHSRDRTILNSGAAPFKLSNRLHELRQSHQLSLESLAHRTGLSKGFLSLIERDLKVPSISTLMKLSDVYGISIGAMLDTAKPQEPYSLVRNAERRKYSREGSLYGYRYEAVAFHKEDKQMEPFVVSPPLRLPRKFFQHAGDEMVFVLSGDVEVHLNHERIRLAAGDCLYFEATTPHRSRSLGTVRASMLVTVSR